MSKITSILVTMLLTLSTSVSAGEFRVNGEVVGDSSVIEYITANYEARVIKIVTNGTATFSRIDETLDEPGGQQQQLVVDDVVIGSSDLITWFLINPNNGNIRLKTNGNLEIIVEQPARNPQITQFQASSSSITEGEEITLTWTSSDTDYCTAESDFVLSGQLATNDSHTFTEGTVGTRNYQITCTAELGGQTFTDTSAVSVTVIEDSGGGGTGEAGIESFTASSSTINAGEPITLTWRSNDVNFCRGLTDFNLGTQTDTMAINSSMTFTEDRVGIRTYVLRCYGNETYSQTLNVQVLAGNGTGLEPQIRTFESSKSQPVIGENFLLNWDAINVDGCVASGAWIGSKPLIGQQAVSYTSAGIRNFTLSCTQNSTGTTVNQTVSVTVINENSGGQLQIASFTATPNPVAVGTNLTLSWSTFNAASCKGIQPSIGAWVNPILSTNGSINIPINEAGDKTFVLRCFDSKFPAGSVDAMLNISTTGAAQPPVTTSISVDRSSIIEGETVNFSWASVNAASCVTNGIALGWAGTNLPTSGSLAFTPRHDSMSMAYGVTCSNATSSDVASVSVYSALPAQDLGTNNCAIQLPNTTPVEWQTVWNGGIWPGPNSFKQTIALSQGESQAIRFNTGTVIGAEAWLTAAPWTGTAGVRTTSITQCPGDYTYGEIGVQGQVPMDDDCIETWGVGTFLKYVVSSAYVANNGICELAPSTDYYMNIRFSSACNESVCRGIFDHSRVQ